MRTRLSVCRRKARYDTREQALAAAAGFGLALRAYACERCLRFHLTSRKARAGRAAAQAGEAALSPARPER